MYKNNNIYIMSLANTTEGNSVGAEVVSKNGEESEFNFSLRPMEGFNCFVGEVNIQFLPSNN